MPILTIGVNTQSNHQSKYIIGTKPFIYLDRFTVS